MQDIVHKKRKQYAILSQTELSNTSHKSQGEINSSC